MNNNTIMFWAGVVAVSSNVELSKLECNCLPINDIKISNLPEPSLSNIEINLKSKDYLDKASIPYLSVYYPVFIKNRFSMIENLKSNWDSYDAEAPDKNVIYHAKSLLTYIPESFVNKLEAEDISPTPYGTITVEFRNGDHYISTEIGSDAIGFFSNLPNGSNLELENKKYSGNGIPPELSQALTLLYA